MHCGRCQRAAGQRGWMASNCRPWAVRCCRNPRSTGLVPNCGRSSVWGVLIERLYGVKFGQTQIWRILGGLGFSVQKPDRRAIERDEQAVQTWKRKTWPGLKKKPAARQD